MSDEGGVAWRVIDPGGLAGIVLFFATGADVRCVPWPG